MAALQSTKVLSFTPPSKPLLCESNTRWPAKTSRLVRSPNASGGQKIHESTAAFSRSGCQAEADRNTAARGEGRKRALASSDGESDDDLPTLEEFFQTAPHPKISTRALKTERTLQHLEQPALTGAGMQVHRTKSGLGGRQGDSPDQPMILDDESDEADTGDKAEGTSGEIDMGRIGRDASPHNTLATSGLASGPTKSIDVSDPWYDIEEGCYIEEPALRLGSCEQQGVTSARTQDQPQTLPQSSQPLQDQISQRDVSNITQSMSVEPTPYSLPKLPNHGDDGWTDDSMSEFEKELELALVEQVNSSSASAPSSPRSRSFQAPEDEIKSRERTDTTGSPPEELRDASQHSTPAQGLEELEQRETQVAVETLERRELGGKELVGEGGGVKMQQQQQQELVAQKEELGWPAVSDQRNLVEIDDTGDPKDQEAADTLPATQLEIDKRRFRLRGIRTRQLAGHQTRTTQYRVVWGEHPNRSDSWVNEDDMRMSMLWSLCEPSSQELVPPVERDVVRVHQMRSSRAGKGAKLFEYLVDELSTWITKDQLKTSVSPELLADLKASSHPLSLAQSEANPRHSASPINDAHRHASRASRSPSASIGALLSGGREQGKWGEKRRHQDGNEEISSGMHHDRCHETSDKAVEDDEGPRPAKLQKLLSAPAQEGLTLQSHSHTSPSAAQRDIDDTQSQADYGHLLTPVDDEHHHTLRVSRSPPAPAESALVAEYQEWPFQGFLKRTKIGNKITYNLEFQLSHVPEHLHLPVLSEALGMCSNKETSAEAAAPYNTIVHSKVPSVTLRSKRKHVPWKPQENETILKKKGDGCSWEEIHAALPHRTPGAIQVQYYTKIKK